jgi:ABC-type multidrug transport system permease subunit
MNPAEFMLQLATKSETGSECTNRYKKISNDVVSIERERHATGMLDAKSEHVQPLIKFVSQPVTWCRKAGQEFSILCERSFLQQRGWKVDPFPIAQMLLISVLMGCVWFQLPHEEDRIEERLSSLFYLRSFLTVTPLFQILRLFVVERDVIRKEQANGTYRLLFYFLAKTISELPLDLTYPALAFTIFYFMTGMQATASALFGFWGVLSLTIMASQSLGLFMSCALGDLKHSILCGSTLTSVFALLGGYYVKFQNISVSVRWLQYLMFPKYAYTLFAVVAFEDAQTYTSDASDSVISLQTILKQNQLDDFSSTTCVLVLVGMIVAFRSFAFFALRRNINVPS